MGSINKLRLLRQVRKNQWLKTSELEELQAKKLRAIVKHAYEYTEFYHRKFKDADVRPEDIKSVEDLTKIPITTKSEVRKNYPERIVSKNVDISKCIVASTGGSTGVPLKIVYDERADDYSKAVNLRSFMENGLKFTSKWIDVTNPAHIVNKKWFQHIRILSPKYVSTTMDVKSQVSIIKDFNPEVISGFSSSLFLIAKEIKENGITKINPKSVFGTAEMLDENDREYINSVFGVKMIDLFGCVELNRTAWECSEHIGYHMDTDSVVIEFIKDREQVAPGERGEIVYTGLYNYAMPLIRYAIGDIGIPSDEKCPCGRGLPLMKIVEGRKDDFVISQDDRIISPRVFSDLMKRISGIDRYKIIQESREKIVVQIVKGDNFSQGTIEHIKKEFRYVLGENIVIESEIKEEIPREPSGKLRKVISKVNRGF